MRLCLAPPGAFVLPDTPPGTVATIPWLFPQAQRLLSEGAWPYSIAYVFCADEQMWYGVFHREFHCQQFPMPEWNGSQSLGNQTLKVYSRARDAECLPLLTEFSAVVESVVAGALRCEAPPTASLTMDQVLSLVDALQKLLRHRLRSFGGLCQLLYRVSPAHVGQALYALPASVSEAMQLRNYLLHALRERALVHVLGRVSESESELCQWYWGRALIPNRFYVAHIVDALEPLSAIDVPCAVESPDAARAPMPTSGSMSASDLRRSGSVSSPSGYQLDTLHLPAAPKPPLRGWLPCRRGRSLGPELCFFVLEHGRLKWFADRNVTQCHGTVELAECTVTPGDPDGAVVVSARQAWLELHLASVGPEWGEALQSATLAPSGPTNEDYIFLSGLESLRVPKSQTIGKLLGLLP